MKRLLVFLLAWFILAISFAQAVPARPRFEPDPQPMPPPPPLDLRGTTWRGKDLVDNRIIVFEADGTLRYGVNKTNYNKATWKLEGNQLYFEMNNHYREFKGTVQGDTIIGESWNKVGKRWSTNLQRDPNGK